jgi:ATP phosphoribosyltransferase regulatory subunit
MNIKPWMLPDGVEEALAPVSWEQEALRRRLLDHYRAAGYELILPPLIEHLESLLTGTAQDLERQTFKLTDPASGRLLGLRADMTPQAARIAARHYAGQDIVRLCYLGTVLRAEPDSPGGARSPRQVGCEIFGEAGMSADLEALNLMIATLQLAGVQALHLDLGHVGVYRAVVAGLGLDAADEAALFGILQRKSQPDLLEWARERGVAADAQERLGTLMRLNGAPDVIARARRVLPAQTPGVARALDELDRIIQALSAQHPQLPIHVDLAELRGYRYKTGLVFAAFVPGLGREIARGGRYDGIGREFGQPRPATGFSADINELLRLGQSSHNSI